MGKSGTGAAGVSAAQLQQLGQELFQTTRPLLTGGADILTRVMQGQRPSQLGPFAPAYESIGQAYNTAREQALQTIPGRGGAMVRSLTDIEKARAGAVGDLEASQRQWALDQGLQLGFGLQPTVASAFGSAAQNQALLEQMQRVQQSATGQTFGMLGAAALKNPQITSGIGSGLGTLGSGLGSMFGQTGLGVGSGLTEFENIFGQAAGLI